MIPLGIVTGVLQGVAGSVAEGVVRGVARVVALFSTKRGTEEYRGPNLEQKGDPIFVFFRTVRKGGLQHKKETQRAPKSTKRSPGGGTRVP